MDLLQILTDFCFTKQKIKIKDTFAKVVLNNHKNVFLALMVRDL